MTDIATTELTADEARLLERSFLSRLNEAQDAYEQFVAAKAWKQLGHDTFATWWSEIVQPVMRALSMRPTREIAAAVVDQVRTEEAGLPPAQRRTQREIGEMVGVAEATVGRMLGSRSTSASHDAARDLEAAPAASQPEPEIPAVAPIRSTSPVGRYTSPPRPNPAAEELRQRRVATHQLCETVVAVAQMRGFDTGWKYEPADVLPGRAVTTAVLVDARQAIDELLKIWDERKLP